MIEPKEITDYERVYYQLQKIQKQVDALSEFISSKLRDQHGHKPRTEGMVDPRTGKPFRMKSKRYNKL